MSNKIKLLSLQDSTSKQTDLLNKQIKSKVFEYCLICGRCAQVWDKQRARLRAVLQAAHSKERQDLQNVTAQLAADAEFSEREAENSDILSSTTDSSPTVAAERDTDAIIHNVWYQQLHHLPPGCFMYSCLSQRRVQSRFKRKVGKRWDACSQAFVVLALLRYNISKTMNTEDERCRRCRF